MSQQPKKKPYALYQRVSSEGQNTGNPRTSLEAARRFVEKHGGTLITFYREEAQSGESANS